MATVECPSCRTSNPSEALYCSACGAAMHRSEGDDQIGMTVGGRYHLVEKIGQGSAGTLYRAEHVTLRRRMAVKLLHKQLAFSDEAVERFRREAITVCEIDNDHIPQVHDFGRTDDDQLFFAMEFLDGETLSSVLEREGRVSPERTADVLSQISDGLMEAHTLGYVHRDLRPRSIFLTRRRGRQDFVKILDFGLAKLVQPEIDAQRTAMGMTYGDPRYMAPEQARGEATDRRADIYSLGVLGFEMLVGEPPFKGGGTFEVLQKVLDAPVPRVRDRRADCPPWLESVIRTALAKRPADRFQTVAQLLDALERKQVLANQPPMPMQLSSQQASKLAGLKDAPSTPQRSAAQMQVFVSSPALKAIPVAGEASPPAATATQAMPTVAPGPRTTVPGQGPVRQHPPAAAAAPATAAPAPRMTMSYPAVKTSRSGTAPGMPGVNELRPAPEPPALTGETKADSSSEMKLLAERLPPAEAKGARTAAAKAAPTQSAARPAESAAKPSLLIASTTQPRNDPTPRTARAMLEQEAMAWEEAALPVLGTTDLTDSASLSEPAGRAPSADTPVEEMQFAPGAAASPAAEPSTGAPRPISAPAIAAMRSMFPGPGGPKSSEQHKALSTSAATSSPATPALRATAPAAEKSTSASASGSALKPLAAGSSSPGVSASVPGISKSAAGRNASVPDASKSSSGASVASASRSSSGFNPSVPGVSKSAPGVSPNAPGASKSSSGFNASVAAGSKSSSGLSPSVASAGKSAAGLGKSTAADKSAAEASASASGIRKLAPEPKTSERAEVATPAAAASVPSEGRAGSVRVTAPLPSLAESPAPGGTAPWALGQPAAAVEPAPFGVGSSALGDPDDDEESADATLPQIRSSHERDDETPIIAHLAASARSPAAPAPAGPLPPADDVATAAMAKTTGEHAADLPHDTPQDGLAAARAAGAESNWFSTPATSATDNFANDDSEVAGGRRRLPKWTLAIAAAGVLLIGVIYLASRPTTPAQPTTPPPVTSVPTPPTSSPAAVTVPPPVVPVPPSPTTPPEVAKTEPTAPGPEVAKTEPATPGPAASPVPVATAIPASAPVKPAPGAEANPSGAETKPATDKPVATPIEVGAETAANANRKLAARPEPPDRQPPEPKAKPVGKSPAAPVEPKATAASKTKPDAEPGAPDRKGAAKAAKETKEPTAAEAVTAPADKVEKKPGEAGALVQSAKKKLEDGEPDAATALFARAVELDPRSAEAVGGLGESYFEQGNFEAAARHLGKAARLAPRRAGYQELLVQALYKVNRFKDAAEACRKLLKLDPSSAKAKQILELADKKLGTAGN